MHTRGTQPSGPVERAGGWGAVVSSRELGSASPTLCEICKSLAFWNQEIPVEMLSFFQKASSQLRGGERAAGAAIA